MKDPHLEDHPTPPSLKVPSLDRSPSLLERLMSHRGLLVSLVVAGLIALIASGGLLWSLVQSGANWNGLGGLVAPASTSTPSPRLTPPPSLEELTEQYPELADLLSDPTLGSAYKDFLIAYQKGGLEAARALALKRGLLNERDEIRITLIVDSEEHVSLVTEELQAAGVTVEGSYRTRINVGVPFSLIQRLSEEHGTNALFEQLTQMEHIIRMELPMPDRPGRVPRVQGEGVSVTGADIWHEAGFTGEGIRIGVLDMGFDGYPALLGSELPSNVTARSFVYGKEPEESNEVHGTACAEIIHEMAPDAELFFAYYDGTIVSKGQAVDWLMEQDVHIISHSAGSVMGPMDGTGDNAELANDAAGQGILWVNSAGNEARGHYRGVFTDADGDGFHEFPDGSEETALWPYLSSVTIVLNWNDWENVTEDYDLFLYDAEGELLASAEDLQDGSPGQSAAEGIAIRNVTEAVYYASIKAHDTTREIILDLYTPGASVEFPVAEHSLNTPADARGALTVGATEYQNDVLASYSSRGPTTDGRMKPEMSAPTGVSGATYGTDGFDGTSASAPHVAGAAALVWSAFPDFSHEQVIAYLESNALDLGPTGPDNSYGYGRLQLSAAPEALTEPAATPPAMPTSPPLPTVIPEPTPVSGPAPVESSPPGKSTTGSSILLFAALGVTGLCGMVAMLIGAMLLVVVWRRSQRTVPQAPPAPAPPPPTPAPAGDYGTLTAPGLDPIPLQAGQVTIGRSPDNDVVLDEPQVSRRHARIICRAGVCLIEDLGSSNGTFVNDQRTPRAALSPGDKLQLGTVQLTYQRAQQQKARAWIELSGKRYPIQARGITIGRADDNDLRLSEKLVSRHHARIERRGDALVLTDLGSTNGTFVNGRLIQQHILHDGDDIKIGRNRMRFHSR